MALSNIEVVRFLTQDNGKLPFLSAGDYIVSDEEIEWAIGYCNNDVMRAARLCAYTIMRFMAGISTREVVGDEEVWNDVSKQYRNAVELFLKDKTLISVLPKGLMPYAAGISLQELAASFNDIDNPKATNWLFQKKTGTCC